MKNFFTLIAFLFGALSISADEITIWEGSALVNAWGDQPFFLTDGGRELKENKAQAGDALRFYGSAQDNSWITELREGHWGATYAVYSGGVAYNEDGTIRESTIVDLATQGYFELVLNDDILSAALSNKGWGGVFLMNGDGNLTITKIVLVRTSERPDDPEGEHEDIIDKFTYTWNTSETIVHNDDKSITYNSVSWGGVAAWVAQSTGVEGQDEPVDWSGYNKIVFEFAEPTTCNTQIVIGENKAWGDVGIKKLELSFSGSDLTKVSQVALQTSEATTLVITSIYLVKPVSTSINKIATGKSHHTIRYNLSGQRVDENFKGVVIMNGKKIAVK